MQSFAISTRGAFKTVMTAGALALGIAGGALATAEPAAAFVHHGGFHHGGLRHDGFHGGFRHGASGHRFAYGRGRPVGHYGFRVGGFGGLPDLFGQRRFAYGFGVPVYRYGARLCGYGRHFVPGLGCRLNLAYRAFPRVVPVRVGVRPFVYGVRRVVHPYGIGRFAYGPGRHFGHAGFRHGESRHGGVHHAGFHHAGFHHGR